MSKKNALALAISMGILVATAKFTRSQEMDPAPATQPATTAPVADDQSVQITNKAGTLKLKLPAGWEQADPSNPQMEIKADFPASQAICIYSALKADVVSLDAFAESAHKNDLSVLKDYKSTDAIKMNVGGNSAIRYDTTYDDGVYKWATIEIYTETATRYNDFTITGLRSAFDVHKEDWAKLVSGLTEVAP